MVCIFANLTQEYIPSFFIFIGDKRIVSLPTSLVSYVGQRLVESVGGDFNFLNTLFFERDKKDDLLRQRRTQSLLLRSAYSFTDRFTVESLIPLVRQTRKISTNQGGEDFESSFGIGDPLILFNYDLLKKPFNLRIGVGPQIPLGAFDKRNDRGILLVEDLQPGSGAWDFIFFSSIEKKLNIRPTGFTYFNTIYSLNGSNNDSRGGNQTYKFGNDVQLILGYSDQVLWFSKIMTPGLALRYRKANRDEIDGIETSGTGGEWLFLKLTNGVRFLNQNNFTLNVEIPLYTYVNVDWHEIVNDEISDKGVAITYCPLTGTAIGWDTEIDGVKSTFGVSGLLYNSNLMPYDRESGSTWSQQRLECVNGDLIGQKAKTYTLMETTWGTWKNAYPDSEVLNLNTGFSREYGQYPYGDYKTNQERLVFPISTSDNRRDFKERVLGVFVGEEAKAYPITGTDPINIVHDEFKNEKLVLAISSQYNFNISFKNPNDLQFVAVDDLPVIMEDNEGNRYDMFGKIVSGPAEGTQLEQPTSFIGYWFSWGTFYPGLDLHE